MYHEPKPTFRWFEGSFADRLLQFVCYCFAAVIVIGFFMLIEQMTGVSLFK